MAQSNFFIEYVERVLRECGLSYLTSSQKEQYLPQITAFLEERIGLEFLPKLDKEHITMFKQMSKSAQTTAKQWKDFWVDAIPDFDEEMTRLLSAFAATARQKLCP